MPTGEKILSTPTTKVSKETPTTEVSKETPTTKVSKETPTTKVTKESISKILIGNRFHIVIRILCKQCPKICKKCLLVKR